jgi:ferredoxin-type protein NapF
MAPTPKGEIDRTRRGILRGRPRPPPLHPPPWADPAALVERCTRCGACAEACPEGIVVPGEGGFPEVRFALGECTFCGACARACPEPVFAPADGRPWDLAAAVGEGCLAARGIVCGSCRDACPEGAMRLRPALGGGAEPRVDAAACTGCGACVAACPADAVAMRPGAGRPQAGGGHGG